MKTATINASKTYDVLIGEILLERSGKLIREKVGGRVAAIITDDIVDGLYAGKLATSLTNAGYIVVKYVLPNGEFSKNATRFIEILNFLAKNHFTRKDVVVALGGGVVGDISGFAAASYMRGVRLVQIPTTLLAAVDSSVGGKTAINLEAGKNLAGTFYQPDLVICDYSTLDTLPGEIFSDGSAEVIKYGVIADQKLFEMVMTPIRPQLEKIITRCIGIKSDIVCADEEEAGRRKILNFGHTFGHAIEKCSNFTLSHGKAVAIGMMMMTRAALKKDLCDKNTLTRLQKILDIQGLPHQTDYSEQNLFDAVLMDKKSSGSGITLVIPRSIGNCELRQVPLAEVREYLRLGLEDDGE